jgi:hypothetical protein
MTVQTWMATQPDAAAHSITLPSAAQPGTAQAGAAQHNAAQHSATQHSTAQHSGTANWALSLSHLILGHETMQPLELEQLVLELTCPTQRVGRPGQVRRRRSR